MISNLPTASSAPRRTMLAGAWVLVTALVLGWQAREALPDTPPFSPAGLTSLEHSPFVLGMDDELGTEIPMSRRYAVYLKKMTDWR